MRSALCVLLGGITTFAVSAALAAWLPHTDLIHRFQLTSPRTERAPDELPATIVIERWSRAGMERRSWYVKDWLGIPGLDPLTGDYLGVQQERISGGADDDPADKDLWGGLGPAVRLGEHRGYTVEDARGWPALAFWCEIVPGDTRGFASPAPALGARGGLPISATDGSVTLGPFRCIPFRPIWRGVMINTAFYAACWALPLLTWPAASYWLRRHRGHCPACNYDLRGDLTPGCPECGWHKPPRNPAPH